MSEHGTDLTMRVEGMTCGGLAEAVRRTVLRLDPQAPAAVDPDGSCVAIFTRAQAPAIAGALTRADYAAAAVPV